VVGGDGGNVGKLSWTVAMVAMGGNVSGCQVAVVAAVAGARGRWRVVAVVADTIPFEWKLCQFTEILMKNELREQSWDDFAAVDQGDGAA
jgi:hypothetical protein